MNTGEETAVIESIQPMFPDVDRETVRAVLESTGFHAESAVEALLGMVAIDGAGASGPQEQPPSGVADLLSLAAEPPSSEQQIADDEALARQLQQQLAWEDQLHNEQIALEQQRLQHERRQLAYPGADGAPVPRQRGAHRDDDAGAPGEEDYGVGSTVYAAGSAVYAAGAATAGAAGTVLSGLWSWATEPSPAEREPPPPDEPVQREMQPLHSPPTADSEVISRGDADRGESGSAGEVRRRPRRAPVAGSD
jgi:hypothetical protein